MGHVTAGEAAQALPGVGGFATAVAAALRPVYMADSHGAPGNRAEWAIEHVGGTRTAAPASRATARRPVVHTWPARRFSTEQAIPRARLAPLLEPGGMQEPPSLTRTRELLARGWTKRRIRAAVQSGRLLRLRAGAYTPAGTHADVVDAGRLLGRLTGTSELARRGVFVLATDRLEVHVVRSSSRIPPLGRPHRIHRRVLLRTPHPDALAVEPIDALYDAVMGQNPRAA